ncbi:hypothetical protein PYCCODRAFT_177303 [Trametes coccinea BRFM310]|uniref:Secreted protein n=1 Tax=Trametes coccinea (strain BRFM310) TaxID=1353009 RepID=A0A1Y2IU03_TRAC3|nr:hypothetical protein PYCCODRAFT_177303 [Trametes coccinea BRFM310]
MWVWAHVAFLCHQWTRFVPVLPPLQVRVRRARPPRRTWRAAGWHELVRSSVTRLWRAVGVTTYSCRRKRGRGYKGGERNAAKGRPESLEGGAWERRDDQRRRGTRTLANTLHDRRRAVASLRHPPRLHALTRHPTFACVVADEDEDECVIKG